MFLTKQQASQRSKKGWDTKRRKNPGKYSKKDYADAAGGAAVTTGIVGAYGGDEYMHERAMWKHHYTYQRPNGETVTIKGFRKQKLHKEVLPTLKQIDDKLRPEVRLENPVVIGRNRFHPAIAGAAGMHWDQEDSHLLKNTGVKAIDDHAVVGSDFILIKTTGTGPAKTGTILAHEMGHGVGGGKLQRIDKTEFDRKTGWDTSGKVNTHNTPSGSMYDRIFSDMLGAPTTPKHPEGPINYQASMAAEDFAESFTAEIKGDGAFHTNYSPNRRQFMERHVVGETLGNHEIKLNHVKPTKMIYKHSDALAGAFLVGVGVAAAGAVLYDKSAQKKFK